MAALLVSGCAGVNLAEEQAEFDRGYGRGWHEGCKDYLFGYLGYDTLYYGDREFTIAWCDSLANTPPEQSDSYLTSWGERDESHTKGRLVAQYDAVMAAFEVSDAFCYGYRNCFDRWDVEDRYFGPDW